ncbi:MAG: hypothetical protein O3C34_19255, partial [Proteobacteria bacterium]|nr:hypothetical protein [Pseudomonadota bacterium]
MSLEIGERLFEIGLTLLRYGGVGLSYSPKLGLKREMWLRGRIEHYDKDERFEGKPVLLIIRTPPNAEMVAEIKTREQVDGGCGWFNVRPNVEPTENDKWDGLPAIQAIINVSPDAFDAVSVHATETLDRIHRVKAEITLIGKSLPETGTGALWPYRLADFDVSERKAYAIGEFKIGSTGTFYPRNRVLPIERALDASSSMKPARPCWTRGGRPP